MSEEILKKWKKKAMIIFMKTGLIVLCLVLFSAVIFIYEPAAEKLGFLSAVLGMPGVDVKYERKYSNSSVSLGVKIPTVSDIIFVSDDQGEYSTPLDIEELISVAQMNVNSTKKGGTIIEQSYTSGSAYTGYKDLWVMNTTGKTLDLSALYSEKPSLSVDSDKPSILIYHTHTSESYVMLDVGWYPSGFSSRTDDCGQNMVRVGEAIADELRKAGFNVIHDKTIYDTSYNGSYQRSRAQVERYLDMYPSIAITLDVHRDALTTNNEQTIIKPVAEINGKKAAQIMLIAGREGSTITDFPNWENNLNFAVQIQNKMNELYSGVMRPLFHCYRKYNMDVTPNSLLVEVGTHGNTLEEAVYSGTLFGKALGEMLRDYIST
ncbi:MAG: stage II sporulation protein P [Clostridia bacterium]|nr:stage II sporulation protein P [Clostridia bacterium]